jgi:endoglucanase
MGYELLGDSSYRDVALEQLHYILGVNPNGTSYVTGAGTKRPYFPHHRPSAADNIFEPVPGLLAGGPDQYRNDPILSAKYSSSTPPALCYADDLGSYASNEIAINWNAPLVLVAGYFAYAPVSTGVLDRGARSPLSLKLGQNYPNPFNGTTLIPFELAKEDEITMRVFDTLGREVAVLPLGRLQPGFHTYQWDTSASASVPLSSGVYFYRLHGQDRSLALKLVLTK